MFVSMPEPKVAMPRSILDLNVRDRARLRTLAEGMLGIGKQLEPGHGARGDERADEGVDRAVAGADELQRLPVDGGWTPRT